MKNKIKKFIKSSPVLAIIFGLVLAGGASAAILAVYVTMTGTATVEQSVVFCDGDLTNHSYEIAAIAGNTYTEEDCIKNRSYTTAPIEFVTTHSDTGVTTSYWNKVVLDNKNIADWSLTPNDNIDATLTYELAAPEFNYELIAEGLNSETEYSLIYYADKQDRWNNYGGDNPGALIATVMPASDGTVDIEGSIDLKKNLPHVWDWNESAEANYCVAPDNYDLCRGAKIWLVPSSDYDAANKKIKDSSWGNMSNFLFETDLIVYDDTLPENATRKGIQLGEGSLPNLFVKNQFAIDATPGEYIITSEVKPVQ